jgi:hypothetical protein
MIMGDTYDSATAANADRDQQRALLRALGAWDHALRKDECGAWTIIGNAGTIHTFGDGATWILYVACRSVRHWTATKARLSFCAAVLDTHEEGTLRLRHLPTPDQASIIREALGIRKRAELDPEELERRRALGKQLAQTRGSVLPVAYRSQPGPGAPRISDAELAKSTSTNSEPKGIPGEVL